MTAPPLPAYPRDGRTWPTQTGPTPARTHLVLEPMVGADDRGLELSVFVDGDGPSVVVSTGTAREVAAELIAHADHLDALRAVRGIRETLRATGHPVLDDLDRAVDDAIDRERVRRDDDLRRVALALGLDPDQARHATVDDLADRARLLDVHAGHLVPSRTSSCICARPMQHGLPWSSAVDQHCPEHSPGTRYGGRPATPAALPVADPHRIPSTDVLVAAGQTWQHRGFPADRRTVRVVDAAQVHTDRGQTTVFRLHRDYQLLEGAGERS